MPIDPSNFQAPGFYGPIPRFALQNLPDEEHKSAKWLNYFLFEIDQQIQFFEYAVELFHYTGKEFGKSMSSGGGDRKMLSWQNMAAHSAILTIYHIDCLLPRVGQVAKDCTTILSHIDFKQLRIARKMFHAWFPDAVAHRNVIGHFGEQLAYVIAHGMEPGPLKTLRGAILNDRYQTTDQDGRILQLHMNSESVKRLTKTKEALCAGIWKAAEAIASKSV